MNTINQSYFRWIQRLLYLAFTMFVLVSSQVVFAATFTVNDAGDAADANVGDGNCATAGAVCTLRAALQEANYDGNDTIDFNFASDTTISISSSLPISGNNITIQNSMSGDYKVSITDTGVSNMHGFYITGNNITFDGDADGDANQDGPKIFIHGFAATTGNISSGIQITSASDTINISDVAVGIDASESASPNRYGIYSAGQNLTLTRVVLSGNGHSGIAGTGLFLLSLSKDISISDSMIGPNSAGDTYISNYQYGISVDTVSGVQYLNGDDGGVEGLVIDNCVVSGNYYDGIQLNGSTNLITGIVTITDNMIGVNAAGTAKISSTQDQGIRSWNQSSTYLTITGNVIAGQVYDGTYLAGQDTLTFENNKVGVGSDGTTYIDNGTYGGNEYQYTGLYTSQATYILSIKDNLFSTRNKYGTFLYLTSCAAAFSAGSCEEMGLDNDYTDPLVRTWSAYDTSYFPTSLCLDYHDNDSDGTYDSTASGSPTPDIGCDLNGNEPDALITNITPSVVSGDWNVELDYTLQDDPADTVTYVTYEYRDPSDSNWYTMTIVPGGNHTDPLVPSLSGTINTFVWDAETDLGLGLHENVAVRLQGNDGNDGAITTSNDLNIFLGNSCTGAEPYAVVFTKADYADWTLEANQDRINANVWITRQNNQGIYNIAQESSYDQPGTDDGISPALTEWAWKSCAEAAPGDFDTWIHMNGWVPPDVLNENTCMHLTDGSDEYYDVVMTSWTDGNLGGGFSYNRCEYPVPVAGPSVPEYKYMIYLITLVVGFGVMVWGVPRIRTKRNSA